MQKITIWIFKAGRRILLTISTLFSNIFCRILFYCQKVDHQDFATNGLPYVSTSFNSICTIGKGFSMNNRLSSNPIGRTQRCIFFVGKSAKLTIGNNVGMSQAALVCNLRISIGNDVKIGGGVCIYDSDFHSLNFEIRKNIDLDRLHTLKLPVTIKDNAFIGAHVTILKGVTIGKNSIIGACSVVTKDVPDNEIWAGNPARMIKTISDTDLNLIKLSDLSEY